MLRIMFSLISRDQDARQSLPTFREKRDLSALSVKSVRKEFDPVNRFVDRVEINHSSRLLFEPCPT